MSTSQKRAVQNYRSRLSGRGLARFEVLGLGSDRELIRALARRLAAGGPEAAKLALRSIKLHRGNRHARAAFWLRSAARPWLGPISICPGLMKKGATPGFDAVSARHQHR